MIKQLFPNNAYVLEALKMLYFCFPIIYVMLSRTSEGLPSRRNMASIFIVFLLCIVASMFNESPEFRRKKVIFLRVEKQNLTCLINCTFV